MSKEQDLNPEISQPIPEIPTEKGSKRWDRVKIPIYLGILAIGAGIGMELSYLGGRGLTEIFQSVQFYSKEPIQTLYTVTTLEAGACYGLLGGLKLAEKLGIIKI